MGSSIANPNWFPQISGKVDKSVEDAIRLSYDNSYKLSAQVGALAKAIQSLQSQIVDAQGSNADTQAQLSSIQSLFSLVGLSVSPVGYPLGFDGNQISPIQINTPAVVNNAITSNGTYVDSSSGNPVNPTLGQELQIGAVTLATNGGYGIIIAKTDVTTTGTSTDQAALRIRKGTSSGTVLDESDFPVVAETTVFGISVGIDPTPAASQAYVLTLAVNSTTETWGNVRIISLNLKK